LSFFHTIVTVAPVRRTEIVSHDNKGSSNRR
jgi:hypothetical protein